MHCSPYITHRSHENALLPAEQDDDNDDNLTTDARDNEGTRAEERKEKKEGLRMRM
jgi:hypothetical protein